MASAVVCCAPAMTHLAAGRHDAKGLALDEWDPVGLDHDVADVALLHGRDEEGG